MLFTILLLGVSFFLETPHIISIKDLIINLSGPFHNTVHRHHVSTHVYSNIFGQLMYS